MISATSHDVPPMSKVMRFFNPVVRQVCTLAVMPPAGPESTVATAFFALAANVAMPPFDCMMYFCGVSTPNVGQALLQIGDVAREDRFEIGVNHRRREPVIFADLRHDIGRERHRDAGHLLLDDGARAFLVLGLQE